MIEIRCPYDPPHVHQYPDDWEFGGASGTDPRADRRWKPSTYIYYDADLTVLETSQTPLCDDQAIDEFTKVAAKGRDFNPVWLYVARPGMRRAFRIPWKYDKQTDEVTNE